MHPGLGTDTAYADAQSWELAYAARCQVHLAKPVDSGELARTIRSAMGLGGSLS